MLVVALLACRAARPPETDVVLDGEGLPDCAASYDEIDLCAAMARLTSSEVEGFDDDLTSHYPIRWIGTEEQPAFCSDDADEAEAWVLERSPDPEGGTHTVDELDARWTDIHRWDAENAYIGPDRIMRCDFLSEQTATPPGLDPVPVFGKYAADVDIDADFFPVVREFARWRQTLVTVQVILSYGEVHTESAHLGLCAVRCGFCDDPSGVANITAVLERQDWRLGKDGRTLSFDVEPHLEAECQIR